MAICDDDKRFLKYLAGEVECWAMEGGHSAAGRMCSVELYPGADAFLFA